MIFNPSLCVIGDRDQKFRIPPNETESKYAKSESSFRAISQFGRCLWKDLLRMHYTKELEIDKKIPFYIMKLVIKNIFYFCQ